MKKLYCVICRKYRKFENSKSKCKNEDEKEEDSI